MCGITGLVIDRKVEYEILRDMVKALDHRGPDETGIYIQANVGLGQSRLSIIDPQNGRQPITNENESIIVVFNGEIFNHRSLRVGLLEKGHKLKNNSDTAILPHMYEEYGTGMFEKLNGQFAIAIYEKQSNKLILARDRFGEKPLYYYQLEGSLCFGSEVKSILKSGLLEPRLSAAALKQVFTFWSTLSNRSMFEHIYQVPPGCYMVFEYNHQRCEAYWKLIYSQNEDYKNSNLEELVQQLDTKLKNAVESRMMSDVPIAFYLSGGLDSSLIASVAAQSCEKKLNTFSIAFEDANYDESEYQKLMATQLGTNHRQVVFSSKEIPTMLEEILTHTEVPLLRTGAFPMYALARLVKENATKVVLSGEGSDELFGGYDIFREAKIREFCSKEPDSKMRASLYKKINNFVCGQREQNTKCLALYYNNAETQHWASSHSARWRMGVYSNQFLSEEYRSQSLGQDVIKELQDTLPIDFQQWTKVQQAQYLEMAVFFSNYLLTSQGDRVSMAGSVECRYPFLDNDIVEFANALPDTFKIRGLNEKYIIKKLAERYLPEAVRNRKKFPYRAPIDFRQFLEDEYITHMISHEMLKQYGVFNPVATAKFLGALKRKEGLTERDNMMFMGIVTTQILYQRFITRLS